MRADIVPGGVFPDYRLPDHTDTPRSLSEVQGDDPLILTLARGHYCPKEHQQHLQLVPCQATFARFTSSRSFRLWALRFRQAM